MKRTLLPMSLLILALFAVVLGMIRVKAVEAQSPADWPRWGRTGQHSGFSPDMGQSPNTQLADITFDPFVTQEQAESRGDLLACG